MHGVGVTSRVGVNSGDGCCHRHTNLPPMIVDDIKHEVNMKAEIQSLYNSNTNIYVI